MAILQVSLYQGLHRNQLTFKGSHILMFNPLTTANRLQVGYQTHRKRHYISLENADISTVIISHDLFDMKVICHHVALPSVSEMHGFQNAG